MEFRLSDEQAQFADTLQRFLAEKATVNHILRNIETEELDTALWNGLSELGTTALMVPDDAGGLGGSMLDAAVLAEALGTAAAPAPFLGANILAPAALAALDQESAGEGWLEQIACGRLRVAVAGLDSSDELTAVQEGGRVSGQARRVLEGAQATHLLCCPKEGLPFLVDRDAEGCLVEKLPSLDRTRPLARWNFDRCKVQILDRPLSSSERQDLIAQARVALAADSLGSAQSLLDRAVAYAKQREQFGRTIASFQAIKHLCADMAAELEPCRAFVWYAAHALDSRTEERHVIAAHVKSHLSEVARSIAYNAILVHGAIGFTHELGVHLWMKRIAVNRQLFGSPETCRREAAVAQSLIDPQGAFS